MRGNIMKDPWIFIAFMVFNFSTFFLSWIINNAWIVLAIGFVLGAASTIALYYFVFYVLRLNESVSWKQIRFLFIAIFAAQLGIFLLSKLVVALILGFPRLI